MNIAVKHQAGYIDLSSYIRTDFSRSRPVSPSAHFIFGKMSESLADKRRACYVAAPGLIQFPRVEAMILFQGV